MTLLALSGCTSVRVNQLDPQRHFVHHVCIKENPKVIVPDFPQVIERGLQRHGISSEVYTVKKPKYCEYHLTYTAFKHWDFASYLHHAEVRLYRGQTEIADAEYHLNGKGGFSLTKWQSVGTKMDPVMDQLLEGYSPERVDRYRNPGLGAARPKQAEVSELLGGFVTANADAIREAANRELCGYASVPGFVGAVKVIALQDNRVPSYPQMSRRQKEQFNQLFYSVGDQLMAQCS